MYRFFEIFRHDNSLESPGEELPWQYPYGLLEKIWLGLWALVAMAGLVFFNRMVDAHEVLWVSAAMIALVLAVPQLTVRIGQNAVYFGRIALSIISSWAAYQRSAQFIESFRTTSYEAEMMLADEFLFGGNPSEWTEALINPVLTEYLQLTYMAYFPMMLLVGLGLLAREKQRSFYVYLLAMNLAFISCHVFYFLVPVRSPFLIADSAQWGALISYSAPLEGLWFTEGMRQRLLDATSMRYDCFPSGHTMHSIL
ncbi:MAG: phosphatase PAP2 family protein, partial [Persicimonas sp.]